ncbi:MAG: DUF4159 domain-containing protein [Deltaproteobacteria bacterium]|nr:DUF4159 domain-containing protein [Deltaproteobacteria bacterium]
MARRRPRLTRRELGLAAATALFGASGPAFAFGEDGAFHARQLLTGTRAPDRRRRSAGARWALEVVNRTSSPARLAPSTVRADGPALLAEPFAVWSGARAPEPLTERETLWLRRYLGMGGILLVDDEEPNEGAFVKGAKEQLARVLPDGSPISIGDENVVFRSFYLLRRATGRVQKDAKLEAVVRGGMTQIIFSPNDLLGALAREPGGGHPFEATPGGEAQREQAVRLAVNIAMYVLCSNYKDDQVHAPFLMRRRGSESP